MLSWKNSPDCVAFRFVASSLKVLFARSPYSPYPLCAGIALQASSARYIRIEVAKSRTARTGVLVAQGL